MYRILLAEDNKLNQVVAVATLKKLGCTTEIVENGAKAVDACMRWTYDAVLMDVMMPEMDGYQATREIREFENRTGAPHVPIIGLSARAMDGDREVAIEAGFSDYLTKPLREAELAAALERWVLRIA